MKKMMLKTTLLAFSAFLSLSSSALAADPVLGKEYTEIHQAPIAEQKEVLEFFSFYCPHCYHFEMSYKIPEKIKADLPQGVKLVQYHVNFLGSQGENLTRAWALAMALGVEDNVRTPLFEAAQKDAFKSMEDIRAVFLANGVTAEQFDSGINSFAVTGLYNKQVQLADELKIMGVPTFFVNNHYQVNMEGFADSASDDEFVKHYVETIKYLVNK